MIAIVVCDNSGSFILYLCRRRRKKFVVMNRLGVLSQNFTSVSSAMSRYEIVEPRASHPTNYGGDDSRMISIGEGAYGVVYKARDTLTNRFVALKKLKIENENDGISSSTLREVTNLMQLSHENIVKLENVTFDKERMCLIFELLEVDLRKYLDLLHGYLSEDTVRSFSAQLMSGLAYCHSNGIMHRDLKPHNILVSDRLQLKIADFGLARTFTPFSRPLTMEVITRWYRAPEIVLGNNRYNCSVDVWSIGCIIAEISNKRPIFMGECDIDQLFRIFKVLGTPTNAVWPGVEDMPNYQSLFPQWPTQKLEIWFPRLGQDGLNLMEKIFTYDPRYRISAKEALFHPFLRPFVPEKDLVDPMRYSVMQTPVSQNRAASFSSHGAGAPAPIAVAAPLDAVATDVAAPASAAPAGSSMFFNKVTPDNNNNNNGSKLQALDTRDASHAPRLEDASLRSNNVVSASERSMACVPEEEDDDEARDGENDNDSVHPDQVLTAATSALRPPPSSSTIDLEVARYDPSGGRGGKATGKYFLPIDRPNLDCDEDDLVSDLDDNHVKQSSEVDFSTETKTKLKTFAKSMQGNALEFAGPNVSVTAKAVVARPVNAAPFPQIPISSLPTAPVDSSFPPSQRGRKRKVLDAMKVTAPMQEDKRSTSAHMIGAETAFGTRSLAATLPTAANSAALNNSKETLQSEITCPHADTNEDRNEDDDDDHDDDDDDKQLLACIAESHAGKQGVTKGRGRGRKAESVKVTVVTTSTAVSVPETIEASSKDADTKPTVLGKRRSARMVARDDLSTETIPSVVPVNESVVDEPTRKSRRRSQGTVDTVPAPVDAPQQAVMPRRSTRK